MSYVLDRAKRLGLTVENGTRPLTLAVTNNDIVNSLKANSKKCALSRAAQRIPNVNAAYFFLTTAYLEYPDRMVRYVLPPSVQKEIVSFDRAKMFAPGIYQLSPPTERDAPRRPVRKKLRHAPQPSPRPSNGKVLPAAVKVLPAPLPQPSLVVKTRFVRGITEPA